MGQYSQFNNMGAYSQVGHVMLGDGNPRVFSTGAKGFVPVRGLGPSRCSFISFGVAQVGSVAPSCGCSESAAGATYHEVAWPATCFCLRLWVQASAALHLNLKIEYNQTSIAHKRAQGIGSFQAATFLLSIGMAQKHTSRGRLRWLGA